VTKDQHHGSPKEAPLDAPYETRKLSYANTFTNPLKSNTIRAIEWMTGKMTLLRLIRKFEARGVPVGQAFFAMAHLKDGGAIILFPSGQVAHSETFFGPAIEAEWNPFTAKMLLKSGAAVLPIFFPGQNTRLYLIANLIAATLRQGLLLHEAAKALNKPQAPVIGPPIPPEEIRKWTDNPRGLMAWLRETTLALDPR